MSRASTILYAKNDKKCVTKYNRIKAVEIIGSVNQ